MAVEHRDQRSHPKVNEMEFGAFVRAVRARLNITQQELARLMDVDTRTVARWEGGVYPKKRRHMRKLQELMDTASGQ